MGKSLKLIKDWKDELEKWTIIDPKMDIICITIQETSKECGSKLFLNALKDKLTDYTIVSEGEGPIVPGLNFHVYVYVCIKNKIITKKSTQTLCIRKQGMCTKPSVGIGVDLGCVKLVFAGSHFPIDTKDKATLGFAERISAMKEINSKVIKPLTKKLGNDNIKVFWAGDMNFRIQSNGEEQLECLIEGCKQWRKQQHVDVCPHLLDKKILDECLPEGDLLTESEGVDTFEKSCRYKESKEGSEAKTISLRFSDSDKKYDKKRIPSYCDRILTRGNGISINTYTSWPIHTSANIYPLSILYSDHEPVYMTGIIKCNPQTGGYFWLREIF
jgi:hypothetical protein